MSTSRLIDKFYENPDTHALAAHPRTIRKIELETEMDANLFDPNQDVGAFSEAEKLNGYNLYKNRQIPEGEIRLIKIIDRVYYG